MCIRDRRKPEEQRAFHMLGLLTALPVLYVCNVDEAAAATGNAFACRVGARAREEGAAAIVISAKIEAEIAVLAREERDDYLATVGLREAGLDRLIRTGYAPVSYTHLDVYKRQAAPPAASG